MIRKMRLSTACSKRSELKYRKSPELSMHEKRLGLLSIPVSAKKVEFKSS